MTLWVEAGGEEGSLDCLVAHLAFPSLSLEDFGMEGSSMQQQTDQTPLLAQRTSCCKHSSAFRSFLRTQHLVKPGSMH